VWQIVEVWNSEADDDGVPFREKIYAVFPGFEPNLADGTEGLHLILLFDPEIGRAAYLDAFSAVMAGMPPWKDGSLQVSNIDAKSAFEALGKLRQRLKPEWDYMCVAPHAFGARGLFCLKSQVLAGFPHQYISALELKDGWLPEDACADKPWLKPCMEAHHHAFFHASDAYSVTDIGRRFTLVKLAQPRIAALRQAFLAADSRLRIAYAKEASGKLALRTDIPDPRASDRPWLRSVTIVGGTSFFAGQDGIAKRNREQSFRLNPDLTCIIGGRMSGKSTFLDGLRVWFDHTLPPDADVRVDVEQRARLKFLSGNPTVTTEIRGPANPTAPNKHRWPARFFTQRELQKSVSDQNMRRQVLYRLIPGEAAALLDREEKIRRLDEQLRSLASQAENLRLRLSEAEQAFAAVEKSKTALERFAAAGAAKLTASQSDQGRLETCSARLTAFQEKLEELRQIASGLVVPEVINDDLLAILNGSKSQPNLRRLIRRQKAAVRYVSWLRKSIHTVLVEAQTFASANVAVVRAEVEKAVIAAGGTSEELNQLDALTESASKYEVRVAELSEARRQHFSKLRQLVRAHKDREALVREQRAAMARVAEVVLGRFPDRIRVRKMVDTESDSLETWILGLKEQGVTRWWNNRKVAGQPPVAPWRVRFALKHQVLHVLGMSDQVSRTFEGLITPARSYELYALRNDDGYDVELKVGDGPEDYRDLDQLSGGAQVSVLLSLVLETDDSTPLVIDQPEDELDKAYLFETLLPALRRLKGRRQVIFATHDANIVVNGDADQVIYLEADHQLGRIVEQGTIEEEPVRNAIVKVLDGGREAFTLRQAKYGF
jgi:hypothetical protein